MPRLGDALKAGIKGFVNASKPGEYSAGGIKVTCPHCGNAVFKMQGPFSFQMWEGGAAYIKASLTCLTCGLIQWFGEEPEKLKTYG
jgi:hypothetical protein